MFIFLIQIGKNKQTKVSLGQLGYIVVIIGIK